MFYGWRVVIGAFVGMMVTGGFYTYSFTRLVNPIREAFKTNLEVVMYSPVIGLAMGLVMGPVTGALVDRYSVRAIMSVGALLGALGFYLMSLSTNILMFTLTFGLSMTVTMNLAGAMPANAAVTRWFVANRGQALGFAAIGTSVGGIVYPALVAWWIELFGWRAALQYMAYSTALIILPLIWFNIRDYPHQLGLTADGQMEGLAEGQTEDHAEGSIAAVIKEVMGFRDILREPSFWLLGMSIGLVFSAFSSLTANLDPYASGLGVSPAKISAMLMLLAAAGIVGKISFGMAADHIPLKHGLWGAQALLLAAFVIFVFEPPYPLMLVAATCIGLSTGGMLPVWNAMMARIFGIASFGRAMGAMGPLITLNMLPGFIIVGRLHGITGSYTTGLILYGSVILAAAALLIPLKVPEQGNAG